MACLRLVESRFPCAPSRLIFSLPSEHFSKLALTWGASTVAQVISATELLLRQLDQAFDGKAWHGPTLRGSLRGLSARDAARAKAAHSIAEIALHCAYWKYISRRRLLQLPKGSFAWKGSNWFHLPKPFSQAVWSSILQSLDQEHAALRQALARFPEARLTDIPAGSKVSNATLLVGIAHHDAYHAGQVRLLKAQLQKAPAGLT